MAGSGSAAASLAGGAGRGFEGFLKASGHLVGVLLRDVVKYALPMLTLVEEASPAGSADAAFAASLRMVLSAVIAVEQRWAASGAEANGSRLADVLEIVEAPIVTLFAQAGLAVDAAYVTELINGVVALLNAQPAVVLGEAAA